jgi:WhiB family transcriptional regulator, redox-sensing transcriptional regulator
MKKPGERSPGMGIVVFTPTDPRLVGGGRTSLIKLGVDELLAIDDVTQAPTLSPLEQVRAEARLTERARVESLMVPDAPELQTLLDLFRRPAWHAQAACKGMGPDAFFPERGQSTAAALAVCEGCEVRSECLSTALADPDTQGVWGGLSGTGRKVLRRGAA